MNGDIHIHDVIVKESKDLKWWLVAYGDQGAWFRKPWGAGSTFFRRVPATPEEEALALRGHIEAMIKRHDAGSRGVAKRQEIIQRATPKLESIRPGWGGHHPANKWASDQLEAK